jgi:hypothetical protein
MKTLESRVEKSKEIWYESSRPDLNVEGSIVDLVSDWRDVSSHYILTKTSSGKQKLFCMQHEIIKDVTAQCTLNGKKFYNYKSFR